MRTVADALVDVAVGRGVTHAFGLLGEGNLEVAYAIENRTDVAWVPLRREDAVVCAADGYAQGSGRVGLALVTHGPALANTVTALVSAAKGRTPLVVVSGELGDDDRAHPQWIDQAELLSGTGAEYRSVRDAASAGCAIDLAFHAAATQCRPVVVGVPTATQLAEVAQRPAMTHDPPADPVTPDPGVVSEVADLLRAAERPVVLAGRGAIGSRDDLCALADRAGCLLATTLLAKGLFHGEPFDLGVCGGFALAPAARLIAEADLVVAFGASLNAYTTRSGAGVRQATLVQVDDDPAAFGRHLAPDVAVLGDSALAARALYDSLTAHRSGYRRPELRHRVAEYDPAEDDADESGPAGLDLRSVARLLDRSLPRSRALVTDLGYFTSEPATCVRIDRPSKLAFPLHFGSIGLGLATAIGLSCAVPEVPTLCAVGDGGLAASIGELDTLSRLGLPVVVAVFDDEAYGVEYQVLRDQGRATDLSTFAPVDVAAVAHGFGIDAMTVRSVDQFAEVGALLAAATAPLLLDFKLNPQIVTRWYRDLTAATPADRSEKEASSD